MPFLTVYTGLMQRRIIESVEDRKVYILIVFNVVVSGSADVAGTEAQDRSSAAEPADMAVAVSGYRDVA